MQNPAVPTNNGLNPGSAFTFGDIPPPAPQPQSGVSSVHVAWEAYAQASYPLTRRACAVVGEWIQFSGGGSWSLVRVPPAPKGHDARLSIATLDGSRFRAQLRGLFVVRHDRDGYIRDVEVVVVSADMLPALQVGDAAGARRRLRSVANDPHVSTESIIDALETHKFEGSVTFSRLLGNARAPFQAQNYGA